MNANELRIGNYLTFEKSSDIIEKVIAINKGDWFGQGKKYWLETTHFEGELLDKFNPIPLTEEWLLKFGFEKDIEAKSWSILISFDDFDYLFEISNKYQEYYQPDFLRLNIKYVHQLQNIYFALTTKELELKE